MFSNHYRLYSVHVDPSSKRPYETAEFVPEGFNLYAFFFWVFWAFYHRLWLLGFLLACIWVLIVALSDYYGFSPLSAIVVELGIRAMVGFQGNDAIRQNLKRRGYIVADMVAAHNLLHAEQRFYDRYLPQFYATPERSATPKGVTI